MYLLAILLPPLAVWIRKGFLVAILNLVLSLFGFIPGVIHALIVVASTDADKRTEKLEKKLGQLIELHETKEGQKASKPIEIQEKKGIDWSKIFTLTNFAWLFTLGLFARTFESLLEGEFLRSVLFIATAAMIAPPTWKALREKSDKMTRNVAAVVTVVLVLLTSANYEAETTSKTKSPESLPAVKIQERPTAPVIPTNQPSSPKPSSNPVNDIEEAYKTIDSRVDFSLPDYPEDAVNFFMQGCEKNSTTAYCMCYIGWFENRFGYKEFEAITGVYLDSGIFPQEMIEARDNCESWNK